jgi:hypothetical protein
MKRSKFYLSTWMMLIFGLFSTTGFAEAQPGAGADLAFG